ncbi:DUF3592 domain-containing protein [Terriglobus tenax]|uniref:DUF3592 domain-containing protein n=1 Tax=Terriglobus tenax TaxID=1111115 RepID=UPI0021E0A88D|nr:DUF3592 domain-containing protein [Terriglobus tenax]
MRLLLNLVRILLLTCGSITTLAGVGLGIYQGWFLLHAETTSGVILSVRNGHPRILFATKQSRQFEVTSAKPVPGVHQGQAVQIAYRVDNPTDAHITSGTPGWVYAFILAGSGVVITYLGLMAEHAYRKRTD